MLRGPLDDDQLRLLQVIYEHFHGSGEWPVWQYADLTMEQKFGLDAAAILATLPAAGLGTWRTYGLTWQPDRLDEPRQDHEITLTLAGLRYVPEAAVTVRLFVSMMGMMAEAVRAVVPDPRKVIAATVTDQAVTEIVKADGDAAREINDLPPSGTGLTTAKRRTRSLLAHEPLPFSVHQADPAEENWTITIPAFLGRYRGIATADDYLDRLISDIIEAVPPAAPPSPGPLDIPYAAGYLDAVWRSVTGSRLFVNLDPASVARMTLSCADEEDFNSLMSALADVLGQVVKPGVTTPPQREALEKVREWLLPRLGDEPARRAGEALGTLIRLRRIRVSTQHADARQKAVEEFREIGMPFPPSSWESAWAHIALAARGALDIIREEIRAGLSGAPEGSP